ncbi:hypothetical protein PIB30_006447 [Stylosanthes scabra]|uniref:Uncharacterized protein n=1 Tax=Stylosanthes scabra TaxID=79078 RepID=A0ABU6U471_9FABA|nr:hypothetical protein [Stylosanthes scabra]
MEELFIIIIFLSTSPFILKVSSATDSGSGVVNPFTPPYARLPPLQSALVNRRGHNRQTSPTMERVDPAFPTSSRSIEEEEEGEGERGVCVLFLDLFKLFRVKQKEG